MQFAVRPFLRAFSIGCVLAFSSVQGTEYSPWFGPVLEIEGRESSVVQYYPSINAKSKSPYGDFPVNQKKIDDEKSGLSFLQDLSLAIAPREDISVELEAAFAATKHRSFGIDSVLFTGRYRFMNDIVGDFVSLSSGLKIIDVFKPSRHDLSLIHHGSIGCEAHLAIGKEFSCEEFWTSRFWGYGAIGVADTGSPWLKGEVVWDHNVWDRHAFRAFIRTLLGLGSETLNLSVPFDGYGSINHQLVDLGARYSYFFECGLTVKAEYTYRVYSKNCQESVSSLLLGLQYDFGL